MQRIRDLISSKPVLVAMAVVAVLGCLMIGHKNFSMDELDTVFITKDWSTLGQVVRYREANMWLYYTVLYFWEFLGRSEVVVRLLSVGLAVATMPLAYRLGKLLFNARVARVATLLLSVNVFVIWNAQNARSYTMVLFLTTLSMYLLARYVLEGGRRWFLVGVALVNVLAVYAHMYALLVIAAQGVMLVLAPNRRLWRAALAGYVITGLLVAPLFLAPAFHAQPVDWIPAPTIKNLGGTFVIWSNDFLPMAVLFAGLLAAYVWGLWGRRAGWRWSPEMWKPALAWVWVVVPVVLSFGFSLVVKPLYFSPYFFVGLVPFTLLVAAAVVSVQMAWRRRLVLGVIGLLAAVRLAGWYSGSHVLAAVISNNNEDWGKTATYLSAETKPGDAVLYYPSMERDKVDYYLGERGQDIAGVQMVSAPYFLTTGMRQPLDKAMLAGLSDHYGRVWLVLQRVEGKEAVADTATIEDYLHQRYQLKQVKHLEWLEIDEYER